MTTGDVVGPWRGPGRDHIRTDAADASSLDRMDSRKTRRRIVGFGTAAVTAVAVAVAAPIAAARIGNSGPGGGGAVATAEATAGPSPTPNVIVLNDACEDQYDRKPVDIEFGEVVKPPEYIAPKFTDRDGTKTLAAIQQKLDYALSLDRDGALEELGTLLASDEKGEYPTTRDLHAAVMACIGNRLADPSSEYRVRVGWVDKDGVEPQTGFDLNERYHHAYRGPADIIFYRVKDGEVTIADWYRARHLDVDLGATNDLDKNDDGTYVSVVRVFGLDHQDPGWLAEEV